MKTIQRSHLRVILMKGWKAAHSLAGTGFGFGLQNSMFLGRRTTTGDCLFVNLAKETRRVERTPLNYVSSQHTASSNPLSPTMALGHPHHRRCVVAAVVVLFVS